MGQLPIEASPRAAPANPVEWPDVELGNQHAHEIRKLHLAGDQVAFVEIDALARKGIHLDIQKRGNMEMWESRPNPARLKVINKEFAFAVI